VSITKIGEGKPQFLVMMCKKNNPFFAENFLNKKRGA